MTTFGNFPGVRINVTGGGVTAVRIGAEEKLVLFGFADDEAEDFPGYDEPTQVTSRRQARQFFGEDSDLARGILQAFGNGANNSFTYAVAVEDDDAEPTEAWESAIDSAVHVVNEGENGVFGVLTEEENVVSHLSGFVTDLRGEYKMVKGFGGAPPSDVDEEGIPSWDTMDYNTPFDNDSLFVVAPTRQDSPDEDRSILGGVSGRFAGNDITNPVYNTGLRGYTGINQILTRSEANDLRDANVIPIKQNGNIRIADNTSTSEELDWERDFWRRRIVDRVILIAKGVGNAILGRINDERTRGAAEDQIATQLRGLVRDRLLQPNTDNEENWFVEVSQDPADPDKVNIDMGITPQGIAKRVDVDLIIDT